DTLPAASKEPHRAVILASARSRRCARAEGTGTEQPIPSRRGSGSRTSSRGRRAAVSRDGVFGMRGGGAIDRERAGGGRTGRVGGGARIVGRVWDPHRL